VPNIDGGIKVYHFYLLSSFIMLKRTQVEASMCYLRGILMLKLGKGHQAKQCFMEALALDIKCYEAFEQLITSEMMNPTEGEDLTMLFKMFF